MEIPKGVIALALVAAGCSAASSGAPVPPAASGPTRADRALHYLKANYRGTAWLPRVKRVDGRFGQLWVTTTLPQGASAARDVCAAVSSFEIAHGGFTGVRVATVDGRRLAWRQNLGDPC